MTKRSDGWKSMKRANTTNSLGKMLKQKGSAMKKVCILFLLLIAGMAGCTNNVYNSGIDEAPQPPEANSYVPEDENTTEDEEPVTPIENPENVYEWTEEEKGLLSIDTDKIVLFFKPDEGELYPDDLPKLKAKYPDLELIRTEKAPVMFDIWYSELTGLSYLVIHWEIQLMGEGNRPVPSGEWHSSVERIYGQADSLITGLIAPIKVEELMEAPGMAEAYWAIGEGPESDRFPGLYNEILFEWEFSPNENDLCIVIPQVPFPGAAERARGIRIKMSSPGFISPTDELEISDVTASP